MPIAKSIDSQFSDYFFNYSYYHLPALCEVFITFKHWKLTLHFHAHPWHQQVWPWTHCCCCHCCCSGQGCWTCCCCSQATAGCCYCSRTRCWGCSGIHCCCCWTGCCSGGCCCCWTCCCCCSGGCYCFGTVVVVFSGLRQEPRNTRQDLMPKEPENNFALLLSKLKKNNPSLNMWQNGKNLLAKCHW